MLDKYSTIIWLIMTIVLVITEVNTYQLVAIWFAIGSLFALLASSFEMFGFFGQSVLFAIVSMFALIGTRPFVRKIHSGKKVATNADGLIGKEAVVIKKITPHIKGRVKVSGLDWSASADEEINEGSIVQVLSIEGVTLKVKKVAD